MMQMPFSKKLPKIALFLILTSLLVSALETHLWEHYSDDTGKTEKQKSVERKLEDLDINLPADSPVLKGEGVLTLENIFGSIRWLIRS